jgi:hypothetical protein
MRVVENVELLPPDRETALAIGSTFFYAGIPCKRGHIAKRRADKNGCVECIRIASYKYKQTNKAKETRIARITELKNTGEWERATASRTLKHHYGITLAEYENLLAAQNGVCAICQQAETSTDRKLNRPRRLAVDHCHKTDKIRGLLCLACNTAIGKLKDDPQLIERAAAYVRNEGELNCQSV